MSGSESKTSTDVSDTIATIAEELKTIKDKVSTLEKTAKLAISTTSGMFYRDLHIIHIYI